MTRQRRFFEFGPFRLDVANRQLLHEGEPVALTPKAFDVLELLVESRGEVVDKEGIFARVWPDTFVEEANLTQNVYTLRKALGDGVGGRRYIETVPRRGYRFVASVEREVVIEEPATSGRNSLRSIAVLPFEPLAGEAEDRYLGLGMADALITRLSNLRQLTVRPTSAVRRYTDAARDPFVAARELRVDAVLDGTIQRAGERIRVTVQLISVREAAPLWAHAFDFVASGIFAIQDSISQRLASELSLQLTQREREHLTRRATEDPEAYQAYARGRYFWNRRSAEALARAIEYFEQAIERDPAYALAHAGIADCYAVLPLFGGLAPKDAFPRATAAASRALALDPGLAEAHTTLAYARFFYDWDWQAAEAGFRLAVELNPGYPTAYQWSSYYLSAMGRHEEALEHARRAQELDPLSLVITTDLGFVYYFGRRYGEAIEQYAAALELEPGFAYARFALGHAYQQQGRLEEAVVEFRGAAELSRGSSTMLGALGQALALAGHETEARALLAELEARAASQYVEASHFAFIHAALGELSPALDWLERACEERSRFVVFLATWPIYDRLRGEPGFAVLLDRVGLPRVA